MAKQSKKPSRKGSYTIRLGEERTEKIERFRARRHADAGQKISTIDEAVNILVDRALALEQIPA